MCPVCFWKMKGCIHLATGKGWTIRYPGRRGVRSKKKFMQEIELEKKNSCMSLKKEIKIVQFYEIMRIYVEHMCTSINK